MDANDIRAKVFALVRGYSQRPESAVGDATLLECDLGLDYLDRVGLVMDVEEELGVTIEDEAVEAVKCVGDLVREAQSRYADVHGKEA